MPEPLQEAVDFRSEADELHAFLATLAERDWSRPTTFQRWTPWDVVAHLHLYDRVSLASLAGEVAFAQERNELVGRIVREDHALDTAHHADAGDHATAEGILGAPSGQR